MTSATKSSVAPLTPAQQRWVIEPLVAVGLRIDQITDLVFRLAFAAIATEESGVVPTVTSVVDDEPAEVRDAWATMIHRMLLLDVPE